MFTLNCKGRLLVIESPLVMGIINITPDSFYEGSRFQGEGAVLAQAEQMLKDGADILDLGAQSTRPGAKQVSVIEELDRLTGPVAALHTRFPDAIISVDTYYAEVAEAAVAAGASIINDISSGSFDENMLPVAGRLNVPYIGMHIKGTPATMHKNPEYSDVTREVLDFFIARKSACIQAGIKDFIIDPGFGFSKTSRHNFELLNKLNVLSMLECPVMLGVSRKSTIYKTLGITAAEALNGTTVLNTIGLLKGVNILRVHDVKEAKEAIKLFEYVIGKI